jgi:hypothetical protein
MLFERISTRKWTISLTSNNEGLEFKSYYPPILPIFHAIALGHRSGELLITDAYQGQKQSGFFLLNNTSHSQDSGVITNFLRDGQVFNLTLLFKESPNSWQIAAKWKRNEGYVEVQGVV